MGTGFHKRGRVCEGERGKREPKRGLGWGGDLGEERGRSGEEEERRKGDARIL